MPVPGSTLRKIHTSDGHKTVLKQVTGWLRKKGTVLRLTGFRAGTPGAAVQAAENPQDKSSSSANPKHGSSMFPALTPDPTGKGG